MAIMLITHSLGVIAEMAQRVIVMYLGRIVKMPRSMSFDNPKHPYTCLMYCAPAGERHRAFTAEFLGLYRSIQHSNRVFFYPRCPEFVEGLCDVEAIDTGENFGNHCELLPGK